MDGADGGQGLARETVDGFNVRAVVHLARKDEQGAVAMVHRGEVSGGIEIVERDAIFEWHDAVGTKAAGGAKQSGFGFADESGDICAGGDAAFEVEQHAAFAPVDPAHRAGPLRAIGGIFGRIEIDEIHEEADAGGKHGDEMRHLRRIGDDGADRAVGERLRDPLVQAGMVEQRNEQGFALGEAGKASDDPGPVAPEQAVAFRHCGEFAGKAHVAIVIGKAADMHGGDLRQPLEQVARADLITPVRRKGDAMAEEEDIARHPRPRAICGPISVARLSGSFFQYSTLRRYCGESGLTSRVSLPGAVRR